MKDLIKDANFPRTLDQRVYHLGIRAGEVANRIVTVGSPSRAHGIASFLDPTPKPFILTSERGFITITGRYKDVPLSIVSIGMGGPNMDFFVREVRECLDGDMVVIRLGSCGAFIDIPVASLVVPRASVAISRNYDYDFITGSSAERPYIISKPVPADPELRNAVQAALESTCREDAKSTVIVGTVNASADSFYSSQGRQTSFPDHNEDLINYIQSSTKDLATLEMETFHLFHLAAMWRSHAPSAQSISPPLTTTPVLPTTSQQSSAQPSLPRYLLPSANQGPRIRAAAAQMVFASRTESQDFITPAQVVELEAWSGRSVLEALRGFEIALDHLHPDTGSVWEME